MKKELIEKELLKRRLAKKINEARGGSEFIVETKDSKMNITEAELLSTLQEAIRITL
jgi:hypothetical protein